MEFEPEAPSRNEASLFDLLSAVNSVLQRVNKRPDQRDIFEDKWSVSEKIEQLMRTISDRPQLRFSELFAGVTSRSEVVVTFLALLELMKMGAVRAAQEDRYGRIVIELVAADVSTISLDSVDEYASIVEEKGAGDGRSS